MTSLECDVFARSMACILVWHCAVACNQNYYPVLAVIVLG